MKNVGKKLCVFLLVAVMVVSLLPVAFANTGDFGDYFWAGPVTVEKNLMPYLNLPVFSLANGELDDKAIFGQVSMIDGYDSDLQGVITIYDASENGQTFLKKVIGELLEALYAGAVSKNTCPNKVQAVNPNPSTCLPGNPGTCLPGTCLGGNPGSCMSSEGILTLTGLTGHIGDQKDASYIEEICNLTGLMQGIDKAHDLKGKAFALKIWCDQPMGIEGTCTFVFVEPELVITENEQQNLTVDKGTVSGTDLVDEKKATGKTVYDVKEMFEKVTGEVEILILNKDAQDITSNTTALVGTGSKVQLVAKDNHSVVLDELTVIVQGDTNGDGKINNVDAQQVLNQALGGEGLEGIYETAGHMRKPETPLGNVDAQMILNAALNVQ